MIQIRKTNLFRETVITDAFGEPCRQTHRVAIAAILSNPLAQGIENDLSVLAEIGEELGAQFAQQAVEQLAGPAVSYGKAAIIGVSGDLEHGAAVIHPKLGVPMRAAIGGGKALIPSNVKIGGAGTSVDIPMGHKDDPWSFDHIDTMTLTVSDGPRPDEMVVFIAYADGGRPNPGVYT